MNLLARVFRQFPLRSRNSVSVTRWSDDGDMSIEKCARRGIESLAGLVIGADIFGVRSLASGRNFQMCAELYYSDTGAGDFIGVYLRQVEFWIGDANTHELRRVEGSEDSRYGQLYPVLGPELQKMILQPLTDGTFVARWKMTESGRADQSLHNVGVMMDDENLNEFRGRPLSLGHIPRQENDDLHIPAFLIVKEPPRWTIFRRFGPTMEGNTSKESYVPVYPVFDPDLSCKHETDEDGKMLVYRGRD